MLGGPGSLVILGIALLVLGPKKLQELAKGIGGLMGEFKKTSEEVKKSIGINELHRIRTNLSGVDLFAKIAEKASASMEPEAPPGEKQGPAVKGTPLPVNAIEAEKEKDI